MRIVKTWRHRPLVGGGAILLTLISIGWGAMPASAAGPPIVGDLWASQVDSRSATLSAEIDPNDSLTGGYFEYTSKADFGAKGFTGAKRVNINVIGSEAGMIPVNFPTITALQSDTTYLYRLVVTNGHGQVTSPASAPYPFFLTSPASGGPLLPDGRGWEMVSPFDKNGGGVDQRRSACRRRRPAGRCPGFADHLLLLILLCRWSGSSPGVPIHLNPHRGWLVHAEHHRADLLGLL